MFQRIFIILHIYVAVVHCEACAEFSVGSSNYKATFVIVTHFTEFKTWNELKGLCDDGYILVSINTEEENNAILDILQENCANGVYAIGLSREMGTDRTMLSSWNWESGKTVEYLYWASGQPNVGDNDCAFGFITNSDGRWDDVSCSYKLGNWQGSNGYGYISCAEFSIGSSNYKATFVIVTRFSEFRTWNELKGLCDAEYNLVSINTEEENNAIFGILQENCANGVYAIGLSRESGSDRTMASSWNWESGETVEYLYWASGEPNVGDTQCAFGYITTSDGRWGDLPCSETLVGGGSGYGYICEKTVPTTPRVTSTVLDASTDVTMHPGTTTNQLMSLVPTITIENPPVTSTLEEATDVTHRKTTSHLISLLPTSETVVDASTNVTTPPGTTTNQLMSLIPTITIANPPVTSTLETDVTHHGTTTNNLLSLLPTSETVLDASTDVTHHETTTHHLTSLLPTSETIDNDLTYSDDIRMTDCSLVNEEESIFDLTAVVISSVTLNVVFAVVIVMLLYRFHDQLFCKSESELKTSEKSQKAVNVCHVIEENAAYGGFNEDVQQPVYVEVTE
ncbi:uncharacterized protein [Antedon mediterranea]|uniref:uncharacterized protein isoform X2 n=1 Tax=Antedon mediterranea TaxID=105859 RepID=UPI003AF5AB65